MAQLTPLWQYDLDFLKSHLSENRLPSFVQACERGFQDQVDQVLAAVQDRPHLGFIFVSGPTSSGKTSFTGQLCQKLEGLGKRAKLISLDDYYYPGELRYDAMGHPDLESIETLELGLLHEHLQQLAEGQTVILPSYDFVEQKRSYQPDRAISLEPDTIILAEGLHGLSKQVLGGFDPKSYLGIFIMPYAQFIHGQQILSPRDLRKLRRCARDVVHRGSNALATLDYWPAIQREEENSIQAYLERADIFINSALAYELTVVAPAAYRALQDALAQYRTASLPASDLVKPGLYYADLESAVQEALRLSAVCELLPAVDASFVPPGSILHEFI